MTKRKAKSRTKPKVNAQTSPKASPAMSNRPSPKSEPPKTFAGLTTNNLLVIGAAIAALIIIVVVIVQSSNTPPAASNEPIASSGGTGSCAALLETYQAGNLTTTASGLQYRALVETGGEKPTPTSRVTVHYRGCLLNGRQFDSSYDRGQSISFSLNGVIRGWTEGLQLMGKGSNFIFYIPTELAYGANPPSSDIPANAPLLFEVQLLDF